MKMNFSDYEDVGYLSLKPFPKIAEAFRGSDIVVWHGTIERQLVDLVEKYRSEKNTPDASKVDQFLQTWRAHKITGSLNIDEIIPLETASAQLAVDVWKSATYFGSLRDRLRQIIASEQELPRITVQPKAPRPQPPTGRFAAQKEEPGTPEANPKPGEGAPVQA
jgi:hypothetical protein